MSIRIAMWSGPRNISTAMLRAWGNRPDTFVCDEPLYAHYLLKTGRDHPGRSEVLAACEQDWRKVVAWLTGPIPEGKPIFYQKHMAHHLLPDIDRAWLKDLTHALLIRSPREMLTSLLAKYRQITIEDTGLPQQVELVDYLGTHTDQNAPIIDARDVLEDPRGMLTALCERLGVPFTDAMLHWPPGPRETDGVWAKYWYDAVERSTGFAPYRPKNDQVPPEYAGLLVRCEALYAQLYAQRLRPRAAES